MYDAGYCSAQCGTPRDTALLNFVRTANKVEALQQCLNDADALYHRIGNRLDRYGNQVLQMFTGRFQTVYGYVENRLEQFFDAGYKKGENNDS